MSLRFDKTTLPFDAFRRLACRGLLLLLALSLPSGTLAAQNDKEMPALKLGQPLLRGLCLLRRRPR